MKALILKLFPSFLNEHFKKYEGQRKILINTGWLISERIFRLGIGLFVSILIARYLGPENYGILSYALSLIAFMAIFVFLGLSGLVVREIIRFPDEKDKLLGTTFSLKFIGSLLAFLVILGLAKFSHNTSESEFWILLIIGLSLFARPFETIDFWFQSQVQSKYTVLANSTAFMVATIMKVLLVLFGATVIAIAATSSLELILASVLLVCIYRYKGFSIFQWNAQFSKAKELLSQSWIIILAGFLALINLRVDQIMLRWMTDASEVGIYSVAVAFSEVWYFIPTAIAMSVYPKLIELKKTKSLDYDKRLQQVFDVLFVMAFSVAIAMTFLAGPLIPLLYGEAYTKSSSILIIHVWAGIFMFTKAIIDKWVLIENALYFQLMIHGGGALVNVLLNFILIPQFGGKGSAIATLISYATSSYLFLFFYPRSRNLAIKISKSFVFPLRFIIYRTKTWEHLQ